MSESVRILFVGELHSSHALSWIELLTESQAEFEVQGLHISAANPPNSTFPILDAKNPNFLRGTFLAEWKKLKGLVTFFFRRTFGYLVKRIQVESDINGFNYSRDIRLVNDRLLWNTLSVLHQFKPHIVHSLGIFPASAFFLRVKAHLSTGYDPTWIIQARGGPDIALNKKNALLAKEIRAILKSCDYFIADNQRNYEHALEMGLEPSKLSMTGPVPGTGGIDASIFVNVPLPSKKERIILWPKAYNCIQSDGLVVVEALRLALPHIGNFRLIATAITPDVEYWLKDFLHCYISQIEIHNRLPRQQLLDIYRSARVLLAPSLSDGVPNSMYEAMASHTVPILSPLDTLLPLFTNKMHTIYARNLDPSEIAEALICAMNDDALADKIALTNRAWLPTLAGRDAIRERVIQMYHHAAKSKKV